MCITGRSISVSHGTEVKFCCKGTGCGMYTPLCDHNGVTQQILRDGYYSIA